MLRKSNLAHFRVGLALIVGVIGAQGIRAAWVEPPDPRAAADDDGTLPDNVIDTYTRYRDEPRSYADGPNHLFHTCFARGEDFDITLPEGSSGSCHEFLLQTATSTSVYSLALAEPAPGGWQFTRPSVSLPRTILEAHPWQFLFLLSAGSADDSWLNTPVSVQDEPFIITLADMVRTAQYSTYTGIDFSWLIPVLANSSSADCRWTNRFDEQWSFNRIVMEHLDRDTDILPCWGTHWLRALAEISQRAPACLGADVRDEVDFRLAQAIEGEWERFQSDTGRFIPSRTDLPTLNRTDPELLIWSDGQQRLLYQGHTLDWLLTCPDDLVEIHDPRLTKAVETLCKDINDTPDAPAAAMAHAMAALRRYIERTTQVQQIPGL